MNPARKGRQGEQDVARRLYKLWFKEEPPPDRQYFIRVGFGRKQQGGDLIVPPDFPFIVEVKNRKINFSAFVNEFRKWVEPYLPFKEKKLLLVFKFERKWWCAVPADALTRKPSQYLAYQIPEATFIIMELNELGNFIGSPCAAT